MNNRVNWYRALLLTSAITAAFCGLSGCQKQIPADAPAETHTEAEAINKGEGFSDEEGQGEFLTRGNSATMVETGTGLYFKHSNTLWSIDKKTKQAKALYTFENMESNSLFWVNNDKLYFDIVPSPSLQTDKKIGLYLMDLKTGETERLADLDNMASSLYVSGDMLYMRGYAMEAVYRLDGEGRLKEQVPFEETIYRKIPAGYAEITGGKIPYLVERYGYMALQGENGLILTDKEGGNIRTLLDADQMGTVLASETALFAIVKKEDEDYACIKIDIDTLKQETVFETGEYPSLLQFRDGMLYYMIQDMGNAAGLGTTNRYYQLEPESKETTELAVCTEEPGTSGFYSFYGNFYVTADGFYNQRIKDYDVYIEYTSFDEPEKKTFLEPAVFYSGIKELGHIEAEHRSIACACGEKTAAEVYVEWLVMDGDSEAAAAMNEVLEKDAKKQLEYGMALINDGDEEWVHDKSYNIHFLTYTINDIYHYSSRYSCIMASGYEYTGGVHGMPYWETYVFDRETGKRLILSDIVNNQESELKAMVSSRFRELAGQSDDFYETPEELEERVSRDINYQSPFYLSEEGIVFYYAPYSISIYSYGFPQVTVPYGELDMKIKQG